jgi:hypothetical protein
MTGAELTSLPPETALRVPEHGNGLLRVGNAGNVGGNGATPAALRQSLREAARPRVEVLTAIADNVAAENADRIRAVDTMLKYGVGTNVALDVTSSDGSLAQTIVVGDKVIAF